MLHQMLHLPRCIWIHVSWPMNNEVSSIEFIWETNYMSTVLRERCHIACKYGHSQHLGSTQIILNWKFQLHWKGGPCVDHLIKETVQPQCNRLKSQLSDWVRSALKGHVEGMEQLCTGKYVPFHLQIRTMLRHKWWDARLEVFGHKNVNCHLLYTGA